MVHALKDPAKVKAGQAGALSRWGGRRIVRLDSLDPRVREAVLALVRADENARADDGGSDEAA